MNVFGNENRTVREKQEIVCGKKYQITPQGVIVIEERV